MRYQNSMGKILALDLGDQWVGSALSDVTKLLARPYKTVPQKELQSFLREILTKESLETIVMGHPRTMRGTASAQTISTEQTFKLLQEQFPQIVWVLWDERLSSKRAAAQQKKPARRSVAQKLDRLQ